MAKVTIREVAKHAGVSTATVSHVLNGTRFVMDKTKKKVLASIKALDYTPDVMARSFKQGRRHLIGFIVPDIINIFYSAIIEEIENTISKHNYRLVTVHTKETKAREADGIRSLASGIVDGIIVASTMESFSEIAPLKKPEFPMIFVDRLLPGCLCDTVLTNNYYSVSAGVQQLISDGHRRIGFITGLPHLSTTHERLEAYCDTLKNNGIRVEDALICQADSMRQSAIPLARGLLETGCTALVVSNNIMTEDVLFYLEENGIPIGRKNGIDILGYNEGALTTHIIRSIHSIDQPSKAIGRAAGEQIIDRILHPEAPVRQIVLQATLTKKDPPPSQADKKPLKWKSLC